MLSARGRSSFRLDSAQQRRMPVIHSSELEWPLPLSGSRRMGAAVLCSRPILPVPHFWWFRWREVLVPLLASGGLPISVVLIRLSSCVTASPPLPSICRNPSIPLPSRRSGTGELPRRVGSGSLKRPPVYSASGPGAAARRFRGIACPPEGDSRPFRSVPGWIMALPIGRPILDTSHVCRDPGARRLDPPQLNRKIQRTAVHDVRGTEL